MAKRSEDRKNNAPGEFQARTSRSSPQLSSEALLESVPVAVVGLDFFGAVTQWNPAAERIFGWRNRDVLGRPLPTISEQERPQLQALVEQHEPGETVAGLNQRWRKHDGSAIEVTLWTLPLRGVKGACVGLLCIPRDTSELELMRAAADRMQEQLRQAAKMEAVGRLTDSVAHDFSNLLTIIIGYGRSVSEGLPAQGPLRDDMDIVLEAAERATTLVGRLLAFSRWRKPEPRVVDLNRVLSDLVKMLRRIIGEHINLVTEFSPDLSPVRADPDRIDEAVLNLVLNARDAMPNGGQLEIKTARAALGTGLGEPALELEAGDYVTITVSDNGIGMDAGVLAHLFEPFFTTKKGGGTGLGLATARDIVRESGGDIFVKSHVGRGTAVTIYLPQTERRHNPHRRTRDAPEVRKGTETVLLVEDELSVSELVRRLLSRNGYEVIEAPDSEAALRAWDRDSDRIDLLLSDIVLPGIDGPQLAEKLTAQRPALRVVLMTGYGEALRSVQQSSPAHAVVLRKPFSPGALLRQVRRTLDDVPTKSAAHA